MMGWFCLTTIVLLLSLLSENMADQGSCAQSGTQGNPNSEIMAKMNRDAGCGKWGTLLRKGVCIVDGYQTDLLPIEMGTQVSFNILGIRLRNIDVREKTITIDFDMTAWWIDPGIKTNFSAVDKENGAIWLDAEKAGFLWRPNFAIPAIA